MMSSLLELTTVQLKQAIQLKEQIESLQLRLDILLSGVVSRTEPKQKVGRPKGKRTMSRATIEKMRAAQQARWAKVRGTVAKAPAKEPKKRGGITLEGRAKLAAAMKARWAARKKGASAPNAAK